MFSSTTHTRTIENYKNYYDSNRKIYSNTGLVNRQLTHLVVYDSFDVVVLVKCCTHIYKNQCCSRVTTEVGCICANIRIYEQV